MKHTTEPLNNRLRTVWRSAITLALVVVLAYVVISHHGLIQQSQHVLAGANLVWCVLVLGLVLITYAVAAAIYGQLALHRLRYAQTVVVEIAASFANRLLPAGLGGLGLHGLYLRRRRYTAAEATAVVSINNLLGIVAHVSLLAAVYIVRPATFSHFSIHHHMPAGYIVVAVIGLALIAAAIPVVRLAVCTFAVNLYVSLRRLQAKQLASAFGLALILTIAYTLALYASAKAVQIVLSPLQVFIVFSIGMLTGTATPTPGGLVGIEAGLYAGFVGYGATAPSAAAAVLIYRLATYWLPLLPGFVALLIARRYKFV